MNRENIENLEQLLAKKIGNKKIATTKTSKLTAPGDNYGGLLLKVDVTLEDPEGKSEDLQVVAKCIPFNEFMQRLFDIQITVKKEIAFYDTIAPLIRQFQREQGVEDVIDVFPILYGARLNLNGSDIVDENSVILMENLTQSGYRNVDRMVGFDLATTKLILKDLATFHSTFLALKLTKPDVFQAKISPHLIPQKRTPPPKLLENGMPTPFDLLKDFLQSCEEVRPILPKLKSILEPNSEIFAISTPRPFFTVSHGDLWVNNIMVKFDKGKPVGSKFVDFQNAALRSPVIDLLFFLLTSVQEQILEGHLDDLIKYYHDIFVENLIRLKCDSQPYSFEELLKEIKTDVITSLGHTIFMVTFVVFGNRGDLFSEMDPSEMPNLGTIENITAEARKRIIFLLRKCDLQGWL